MNGKELSAALRSGRLVYGTAISSMSPTWAPAVKGLGIDLVFLDTEHTPVSRNQLAWICQTYRALGVAPIVRIPRPDPYQACMVLDGGAEGIIAPYVESAEEVQAMRGATKFRPLKGKRLAKVLAGEETLEPAVEEYLANRNQNVLIIMIESKPALEALDEILAVPQIDAILIGPNDLSISLGIPDQYRHPLFDEAVRTIIRKARERNIGAGIHFSAGIEQEIAWAEAGANLIMHASDAAAFRQTLATDFRALRQSLEKKSTTTEGPKIVI